MASTAAGVQAMHYRRPWYWLVVLAVAAVAATVFVAWNARARVTVNNSQFEAMQRLRLQRVEQRIDEYFQEADHTAVIGAQTLGGLRDDRVLLRTLTLEIFRSHRDTGVYGVGVFFAPFVFDPHADLVSDYVHSGDVDVFYIGSHLDTRNSYLRQAWYKEALLQRGRVTYDGPNLEDGRSFISTVKAFYQNGRVAGVMAVDTLTPWFKAMMVSALSHGDIAWIQNGHDGRFMLGTSKLPNDTSRRIDRRMHLRFSHAYVHISSDASGLYVSNSADTLAAIILVLAIWVAAVVITQLLVSRWRAQEETLSLELEQARLESKIAVGKTVEEELRKAAYTDAMTGLPNRAAFLERVSELLKRREDGSSYAILFVNLDRFKVINETLGHFAGDELLRLVALRLAGHAAGDMLARLGADEFVIVAQGDEGVARSKAQRALELIARPLVLAGRNVRAHASIGIACVDATYARPDDLLRDAGIALKEAKRRGRARIAVFGAAMRAQAAEEADLELSLRRAMQRRELVPYYQPIVNIATGAIASFEALVRWNRPGHGTISAAEFMPFAESHALVHEIDGLVLPQVARHCATLFASFPDASVAVNLSAAELSNRDLAARIESLLEENNLAPSRLKLEITETSMMTPSEESTANLEQLRGIGVQLVLDDFGTGYSSLAYLQRLPVVGLKIDRSFVENVASDERNAELVRNIVALARTFSLYTVAEGVETLEQLDVLSRIGIGFAQGYVFSPAVDIASVAGLAWNRAG
jgi:diguanylate cyclase (GGDEF)-like protein